MAMSVKTQIDVENEAPFNKVKTAVNAEDAKAFWIHLQ